ncbi:MAG: hypothetical protein ACUVQM_05715 [Candidatus Hadarchaeaceae archaeon]
MKAAMLGYVFGKSSHAGGKSSKIGSLDTILEQHGEDALIFLDTSGLKATKIGEWIRKRRKVHRLWIKIYIAVYKKEEQCIEIEALMGTLGNRTSSTCEAGAAHHSHEN